jgi:hypothetical protein
MKILLKTMKTDRIQKYYHKTVKIEKKRKKPSVDEPPITRPRGPAALLDANEWIIGFAKSPRRSSPPTW